VGRGESISIPKSIEFIPDKIKGSFLGAGHPIFLATMPAPELFSMGQEELPAVSGF
jgi:hypothetical protein